MEITAKLLDFLTLNGVQFQHLFHPECRTSGESRQARADAGGADVIGAKAILIKGDRKSSGSEFNVLVLPGDKKIDSAALKRQFKAEIKSFRFATSEEMAELTGGLVPGSIPPFAQPIFEQLNHLYVDSSLLEYDQIGFNAASLTQSLIVACSDYVRVANPTAIFAFSC